jgi:hypothetical protein
MRRTGSCGSSTRPVTRGCNAPGDEVLVNLLTALTGLRKRHTKVFWVSGPGQPVGPEEPADPVAPADPTT